MSLNNTIGRIFKKFGYTIYHVDKYRHYKNHVFLDDLKKLLKEKDHPLVFDIGANKGQTIDKFRTAFPNCVIHSFEPSPETFTTLKNKYNGAKNLHLQNIGIGSTTGKLKFFENSSNDMSSFLEKDTAHGNIIHETMADVITIDDYCRQNNIDNIDVLKSDSQGYEYEIFRGASGMMKNINAIFFEFILANQYKGLPSLGKLFTLLEENNFRLVNFYSVYYENNMLAFGDLMFVNLKFKVYNNKC